MKRLLLVMILTASMGLAACAATSTTGAPGAVRYPPGECGCCCGG